MLPTRAYADIPRLSPGGPNVRPQVEARLNSYSEVTGAVGPEGLEGAHNRASVGVRANIPQA